MPAWKENSFGFRNVQGRKHLADHLCYFLLNLLVSHLFNTFGFLEGGRDHKHGRVQVAWCIQVLPDGIVPVLMVGSVRSIQGKLDRVLTVLFRVCVRALGEIYLPVFPKRTVK